MSLLVVADVLTPESLLYLRGKRWGAFRGTSCLRWNPVTDYTAAGSPAPTFEMCLRVATDNRNVSTPPGLPTYFHVVLLPLDKSQSLFLLKERKSTESVRWLIALFRLIKCERSAALKARLRYEPWKQVTSKWRGVSGMTGTVTPLEAGVQLFNNAFLNAKFSTVHCGLPISPDTRLISARPKELIYTSS